MSALRLSFAISDYVHTRSLSNGRIRPEGIDLTVLHHQFEHISYRFRAGTEFDVGEFSFGNYCARVAHLARAPMIALPVFTSRVFRHSAIYVRADTDLRGAADLAGRRVGIPQWTQTATIYVRGMLAHDAGVPLSSIRWVQAGLNEAGRKEGVSFLELPAGIEIEPAPQRTLNDMLLAGELDAVISARPPKAFVNADPLVRRLFTDYRTEEQAYFARTGIFPIMHVVVLRRDLYEENRWIARNLYDAFVSAKNESIARLEEMTTSFLPTAWAPEFISDVNRTLFPDGDPWPYGIEPNRTTIEAFLAYCFEQGVTARKLSVEELFPEELALNLAI